MRVVSKSVVLLIMLCLILPETLLADKPPGILVIGDSLSSAYGLKTEEGWVSLLRRKLADNHYPHRVINASITGETTRGGLSRLPDLLQREQPALVIIELGGNDGLRGFPLSTTRNNLAAMIEKSRSADAGVLLLGVRLPVNYGEMFRRQFEQVYRELQSAYAVALVPYFLKDIGENMTLMQGDGIHPSAEAQTLMLDNVWPSLEKLINADN